MRLPGAGKDDLILDTREIGAKMIVDPHRPTGGVDTSAVIRRMIVDIFVFGTMMVLISSCSYPISRTVREQAAGDLTFTEVLARPAAYRGVIAVWGGVIMKTVSRPGRSELVLWETPLDYRGRPEDKGFSNGLFIARTSRFLDPVEYSAGRKVTVAGKITGGEPGTYNDEPYLYPVLEIKEVHLWREPIKWNWGRIPYYWPNQYSPPRQYRQPLD